MITSFHWSDYFVFAFWLLIYTFIGIYHRYHGQIRAFFRRIIRCEKDLFLSNRQLSLLPIVSSLMASFLSAVSLMGTTTEAYLSGLQFICMILAYIIAFPLTAEMYMPVFYKLRLSCAHEVSLITGLAAEPEVVQFFAPMSLGALRRCDNCVISFT
ncbi:unnamed protein product [Echinostoma caproni]|uniref:Sodium-dependent multivitamin transporter n=1 Tax=Echinostoma caproni TaxID=27848 RepID=A0A183BBB5_9TREM|nr:unnamed protein product [Echinostoma caproni]